MDILAGKSIPETLNHTFVAIIPKVDHLKVASQFRPIGLCNLLYKTVTKTLINRLKPALPKVICPTQGAFVLGWQITDNIVIVQEVLHTMRKKQGKSEYMTIKIDFEKACDRLKWSFIRDTLMEMQIPILLIEVIMMCVASSKMYVLWNGHLWRSLPHLEE